MTALNAKNFKLESQANVANAQGYNGELFDRYYDEEKDQSLEVFTNLDGSQSVVVDGRFEFDQETEKEAESEFIQALLDNNIQKTIEIAASSPKNEPKFAVVRTLDKNSGASIWCGEYIMSWGDTEIEAAQAYAVSLGGSPKKCAEIRDLVSSMSIDEIFSLYNHGAKLFPVSQITARYLVLICNNGFDVRAKIINGAIHKLSNKDASKLMNDEEILNLEKSFLDNELPAVGEITSDSELDFY